MLRIDNLHTYYGDSHILRGISLEVGASEAVALLGRNGAGKSTTINSIVGFTHTRRGTITFGGQQITDRPAYEIARLGIGLVPQGRKIFPTLTVQENMTLAASKKVRGDGWSLERVLTLFSPLATRLKNLGSQLSGGEQQMLAIGRALMANPRVLLLDEPSMGLAPILVEDIFRTVKEINAEGTTVLLVEQNALMALSVANRGYVLETGTVALEGTAEQLRENPQVKAAYLGEV